MTDFGMLRIAAVLRELQVQLVRKVLPAHKELPALQAHKALLEQQVQPALPVLRVRKALLEPPEQQALPVLSAHKELQVLRVQPEPMVQMVKPF
jgi:hypothetical protein